MMNPATYELELRLDGVLIGDVREIAESLVWTRKRTRIGVDSISFTLNDQLFAEWCKMRSTTVGDLLRPLALDCRVVRNGVLVVGGFLATMPSYQPKGSSASLAMKFDGYINYLAKVYLNPGIKLTGKMGDIIKAWITVAEDRATKAGKGFGFQPGVISDMATVESSFQNYKDIKSAIADRCDNVTGAGPFEVYFHPDRTYDVIKDVDFGDEITDYIIEYPTVLNAPSATSISAKEISGFASTVIGIGSGEVSGSEESNTAITDVQTNSEAVQKYGYAEEVLQESSVSQAETLARNVASELAGVSNMQWQPEIKMSGRHVNPTPGGERKIWIGDTVKLQNNEDQTGMTNGDFRVNALQVSVKATGAEEITPSLSRGDAINTTSFAKEFVRMQSELLALKTASNYTAN